jgi:hypothetical protein
VKIKDIALGAFVSGIIAVILKDIFDFFYFLVDFPGVHPVYIAAGTFLSTDRIFSPIGIIIGYVAHLTVGGLLGFIFLKLLVVSNPQNILLKGIFYGLCVWLLLAGALLTLGISRYVPTDEYTKTMLLLDHLVYGSSLGYLIPKISKVD